MHCVYVIRNLLSGQSYVGQTKNFAQRKASHLYSARKGDQRPLYGAIREFGIENFVFELLEEHLDAEYASEREMHWVTTLDSFCNGYNLTHGGGFHVGNKGRKFTEEHKHKISEAHKGKSVSEKTRQKLSEIAHARCGAKHPMFGKQFSDEVKRNMRAAKHAYYASPEGEKMRQQIRETLSGRTLSDETRQKISAANRGQKRSIETIAKMKNRKISDETRLKLSEAAKRREERKRQKSVESEVV